MKACCLLRHWVEEPGRGDQLYHMCNPDRICLFCRGPCPVCSQEPEKMEKLLEEQRQRRELK